MRVVAQYDVDTIATFPDIVIMG